MTTHDESSVQSADRVHEGIIITFHDGRCALFSHALLRETFPKATEIHEDEDEDGLD